MILIHLSVTGKPAIIDEENILMAEEAEGEDRDGKAVEFTRIFLRQPIPGENEESGKWVDVKESVRKIMEQAW